MMLFVGLSGLGAPQPTSFVGVEQVSVLDESLPLVSLTEDDRKRFPTLFHALENGITHIDVYYPDVPEGGMPESEYYAISDLFEDDVVFFIGPGYVEYEGSFYHIFIGALAGQSGLEGSVANFLRGASRVLIFSGVILLAVNFVRSFSSTVPESRTMRIQTYIAEHPGCSEADIVRTVGYSRGSTVHHLKKLIRDNRIRTFSYQKTRRYYPAGVPEAEQDRFDAASAKEKPAAILSALEAGSLTVSELAEKTGLSESTLYWYLAQMEKEGVVTAEKAGKSFRYSLTRTSSSLPLFR